MAFAIDVAALREMAAQKQIVASPAKSLIPVSNLATLATTPGIPSAPPLAWTEREIESFNARFARLTAVGMSDEQAEALAERLVARDRQQDDRTICAVECRHFRPGTNTCGNHRQADMPRELGDIAGMPQRCAGFAPDGRLA